MLRGARGSRSCGPLEGQAIGLGLSVLAGENGRAGALPAPLDPLALAL